MKRSTQTPPIPCYWPQVEASLSKLFDKGENFLLPPLALSDVIVRCQDRSRPSLLVSSQGPSGRYDQPGSVSPGFLKFAVPTPGAQQLRMNLLNRHRKDRLQKLVSVLTDRFIRRPAEQLLRAQIPVSDDIVHITDENAVVSKIQQTGLLGSLGHFDFELVASDGQLPFDYAPDSFCTNPSRSPFALPVLLHLGSGLTIPRL